MPLLADYAITPDVFDVMSYSTADECAARIETIREAMLTEGVVRDLRDGAWSKLFLTEHGRRRVPPTASIDSKDGAPVRPWHRRGVEIVRKLYTQRRLVNWPAAGLQPPADDGDWCAEALATHEGQRFSGGVIVTKSVKVRYAAEAVVARIDELSSASWWAERSPSTRLRRTIDAYKRHLGPVLRWSKSLMFIDPHLDPGKRNYRDFPALLRQAGGREQAPLVEIHRRLPDDKDTTTLEDRFRQALAEPLCQAGLGAQVFIWKPKGPPFHDRYLISNLIGISLPYGFDVGGGETTWTTLGRNERDAIQREFDPANRRRMLVRRFEIRGTSAAT